MHNSSYTYIDVRSKLKKTTITILQMRKILILSFLIMTSNVIWSQTGQINGFKNFKFNSTLKDYSNFEYKKESDWGYYEKYLTCYKVLKIPTNLKVGVNSVYAIHLYCFNDRIVRIDVDFDNFSYEELQQMFGTPNKEDHWCSENISNGEERAVWDIPNSIIRYFHSWNTKEISNSESVLRSKSGMVSFNLPTHKYILSFKIRNYEDVIKSAQEKGTKESLNDFNTPIN